mmetsp:Transcript_36671/g.108166  ORF Transcript_36671/g.108166 Transcript_36671/m.108166 type:complete len:242 (+) Transcript_36671:1719-2444(+)
MTTHALASSAAPPWSTCLGSRTTSARRSSTAMTGRQRRWRGQIVAACAPSSPSTTSATEQTSSPARWARARSPQPSAPRTPAKLPAPVASHRTFQSFMASATASTRMCGTPRATGSFRCRTARTRVRKARKLRGSCCARSSTSPTSTCPLWRASRASWRKRASTSSSTPHGALWSAAGSLCCWDRRQTSACRASSTSSRSSCSGSTMIARRWSSCTTSRSATSSTQRPTSSWCRPCLSRAV